MNRTKPNTSQLFAFPLLEIQLDLDVKKLTEWSFQLQKEDKKGVQNTNRGGWHSSNILKETHEEFIKLKKEINYYLQIYHSEAFAGVVFKERITISPIEMWVNINEKHHYNEWHIHPYSTLSGVYYIKHDGSDENGNISFKHPNNLYMKSQHWPEGAIEIANEVTSEVINVTPISNRLLIFPSWLEHNAEMNLKDDTRISLSFNTQPMLENHNG